MSIPDLSENPEAERVSPARGIQQPILPATPKKSTTSYATTGEGGYVPDRTWESRQRREDIARVTAPSPREALIDHNIRVYRERQEAEEAAERRRQHERREQERQQQERMQREIERLRKTADFRKQEILVESIIQSHGLSTAERSAVYQRCVASGKYPDCLEFAEMACQQVVLERGTTPASPSSGQFDWKAAVIRRK
jgi:hypothetical protein